MKTKPFKSQRVSSNRSSTSQKSTPIYREDGVLIGVAKCQSRTIDIFLKGQNPAGREVPIPQCLLALRQSLMICLCSMST